MPLDGTPHEFTEFTAPTKADVMRLRHRAADLIQHRGHCQGNYWDGAGRTCLANALYEAETGDDITWSLHHTTPLAAAAIVSLGLAADLGVCGYNNTHDAREIVALLRSRRYAA